MPDSNITPNLDDDFTQLAPSTTPPTQVIPQETGSSQPRLNKDDIWKIAMERIQLKISPQNYTAWFKNTYLQKIENGMATISCPSNFSREWLDSNHHKLVRQILQNIINSDLELIFIVSENNTGDPENSSENSAANEYDRYENMSLTPDEAPIFNVQHTQQAILEDAQHKANLNPMYLFDNFVIGPSNRVAHAAAQAVADNPGRAYNPLFIYGGTGLGKTHLIHAVGNFLIHKDPNRKVLYCPSETFLNEMVDAIRNDRNAEFRQKYRQLDLLVIDDIQFISEWERSQTELFHTFNTLYESGKQIILASDRRPEEIENLAPRLMSRFKGGMVTDITSPDYELRLAIVRQKAEEKGMLLPNNLLNFIAKGFDSNIRELEGALMRIGTHVKIGGVIPTEAEAAKILEIDTESKRKRIAPRDVILEVCKCFGVSIRDIRGKRRNAEFVEPRQVSMYILRKELGMPLETVAKELNRMDHTTVLHAIERVENKMEVDEDFREKVRGVKV
jgi:chromosomal replication initiator protein